MRNQLRRLAFLGFMTLFMACHKNNYVTNIPAPHFNYVKPDPKTAPQENDPPKQTLLTDASAINHSDSEPLVLATVSTAPPSFAANHFLNNSVSKVAAVKSVKELSASTETAVKKPTLQERMFRKMLTKQIEKKQSGTRPKAGKTNTVSLLSGIAGIVGLVLLFTGTGAISLVLGAAAIIMGFVGKAQIRRNDERGVGWAITGIVSGILIYFLLLLAVLFIASLLGL
ncbi:MAG: DUF4190 domain-containing protein [Spirosomataceae bacterium]